MIEDECSPANSALFTERIDPETGVKSFLLDFPTVKRSRALPRSAKSARTDGQFIWIYATRTDSATTLSVVDLRNDTFAHTESVSPADPTPVVNTATSVAYAALDRSVVAYDPVSGSNGHIASDQIGRFNGTERLASELTRSVDGDRLCVLEVDHGTYRLISLHIPTGETDVWHSRSRRDDIVQFSPTDPTLVLLARNAGDRSTGGSDPADTWLAREGLGARPLNRLLPPNPRYIRWDPNGTGLWYVEPDSGIGYLDLHRSRTRSVLSKRVRRADSSRDGDRLVATVMETDRTRLTVFDLSTNSSVDVVSALRVECGHPQFVAGDTYVAYTMAVNGHPTFALTPLSELEPFP